MKQWFNKESIMSEIKSSEIIEIALNSSYNTQEDLDNLLSQGIPARWMTEDEENDKNIFTFIVEE